MPFLWKVDETLPELEMKATVVESKYGLVSFDAA